MKKIFIKYNPYKLETEITIDESRPPRNSKLAEYTSDGSRLQEWIEELPHILIHEYYDNDFEIRFYGTLPDYEDLTAIFNEAIDKGILTAKLERIPAKETSDKEILIEKVFNEILEGPFDELRDNDIRSAFEYAKSSDFEVCVIATMSAGKSTLINAMLGTKLMPSKQEACTTVITRIKDTTQEIVPFQAEVYDVDGKLFETDENLTYQDMERLNADKHISLIKASGNIPFVSSEDVSLVLIDTPGPNNSRDRSHEKIQRSLLGRSSKALILYIMTGEFGTDDDNALLNRVSESMAIGGKQSKDRFIFVVNKLDDRKKEDGDVTQTLSRVRDYLRTHGIKRPNLFLASALPALNIRMLKKEDDDIDEDTRDETEIKVKKLNRNEGLHFEKYATLPPSIRDKINDQLEITRTDWDNENKKYKNPDEALIHTGIISIEAAISQYVNKYAKTAKIKNTVDTFIHKLDSLRCFEKTKQELANNQLDSKKIVEQIQTIRDKMDNAKEAKKYSDVVVDAIIRINDESQEVIETIIQKFQNIITRCIDELRDAELSLDEAEFEIERLIKFAQNLEPDFEVELDELIRKNLINTCEILLENYKRKLASLADEVNMADITNINIDPLKLMSGNITMDGFSMHNFIQEKKIEDGEVWVSNPDYGTWYRPWSFFTEEKGYWKKRYKEAQYIAGYTLAQEFFTPVQQYLYENGESTRRYAIKQSKRIIERFSVEFKHLDDILKKKLTELEIYATEKKKADERIRDSENKLRWLKKINTQMESILEI